MPATPQQPVSDPALSATVKQLLSAMQGTDKALGQLKDDFGGAELDAACDEMAALFDRADEIVAKDIYQD